MTEGVKTQGESAASAFRVISEMSSGDRAKMRRGDMTAAFWRTWEGAALGELSGMRADRWGRFFKAVAIFVGTGTSEISKERLGKSIAESGISTSRFEKMITAPVDVRADILDRMVVQLAKNRRSINVYDLCELYLYDDPRGLRDISRSFYMNIKA